MIFLLILIFLASSFVMPDTTAPALPTTALSKWFGSIAECELNAGSDCLSHNDFDFAFGRPFANMPTDPNDGGDNWLAYGGHCCKVEMPIENRGLLSDLEKKEFNNPDLALVTQILTDMSHHNLTLVFVGDSIGSQTNYAFIAELRRECLLHNITLPESVMRSSKEIFTQGLSDVAQLYSAFRWMNIFIFYIRYNSRQQIAHTDVILKFIEKTYSNVVVFGNFGLHLSHNGREHMEEFVLWMSSLNAHAQNIAVLVETSATHFPSVDGTFESWQTPDGYNAWSYNTWDREFPNYHCRQLPGNVTSRRENDMMYAILTEHNLTQHIQVVEVFEHFAPYYRLHYGNCPSEANFRTNLVDCVHFCAFDPLMWLPIWQQMLQHLETELSKKRERRS